MTTHAEVLKIKLSKNVYIEAQTTGPAGAEYMLKRDEMPIAGGDEEESPVVVEDCAKNDETASAADGNATPNSQDAKTSPPSVQSDEMSGTSTVVN